MINDITRGLIIKKQWLELILSGRKVWEMRSTKTKVRGTIALIEQGSGLIVGQVELVDSPGDLTLPYVLNNHEKHLVDNHELLNKWRYPWILDKAIRYDKPIPYNHPQGAVVWVRL